MCTDCWERYEPVPVTPEIKDAVAWLCVLYEKRGAGGLLHVYVDDWNLPLPKTMGEWLQACGNSRPDDLEVRVWQAMKDFTEEEQATALAIYDGYYRPDGCHPWTLKRGIWGRGETKERYWSEEVQDALALVLNEFWEDQ